MSKLVTKFLHFHLNHKILHAKNIYYSKGNNVVIAGKSGVTKNIKDNEIVAGFPAKNIQLWKRDVIKLSKLK